MKHTPGPWEVDGDLIQAEDNTVAHEVNNEADARLIAAAPELLNFVNAFAKATTSDEQPGIWGPEAMDQIIMTARELLSRIEGGS